MSTKKTNPKASPKGDARTRKTRIILLDSHAILHRAYHALPDFSSPNGEPTGALYGLAAMLFKIVEELKPDYVLACYDLPEATFRHEVYDGYKAGRSKTDDELAVQITRSRDVFAALNIPLYEKAGFEADDLLGTLSEVFKKDKKLEVIIASGDMDTLQLVDKEKVRVYTLRKGIKDTVMYDEDAVNERFGFGPELLPDYKGLRGDPSDNIIGVSGIGEKTATDLITKFGTLEKMYKLLAKGDEKFIDEGIKPRIVNLLKENEEEALFSKELATIRRDVPVDVELPKQHWRDSLDPDQVIKLFTELGFRTLTQRFRTLFGFEEQTSMDFGTDEEEAPKEEVDEKELHEISVALYVMNSDISNPTRDDILGYADTKSFKEAKKIILADLKKEKLEDVYEKIEKPLIPVVEKMNATGVLIDQEYLAMLSTEYHKDLSKIEKKIFKHAGSEFNVNSPRQLGKVLFDDMGLTAKGLKKTEGGQRSTRESELEKMRDLHPIIDEVLEYRELQKLLSTYIDNLPHMIAEDGRLRTQFVQSGAATGRMSSLHPNLQNIPIRTERGKNIRNAFVAPRGSVLVALDYSQIELRIAAFLSEDEKLLEIFKEGGDIHKAVAAEMFHVDPKDVDPEMRRRAKVINFGILYGMGVNALRGNLGVERKEAQDYLNNYFETFMGLARYLEMTKAYAHKHGYTLTMFGRRRKFEMIRSSLPHMRAMAERMAINAPIQGSQSDIIKIAMVKIDEYLTKKKLDGEMKMLLQVHDELVFEMKKEVAENVTKEIQKIMEGVVSTKETKGITLKVDSKEGKSWGEMG